MVVQVKVDATKALARFSPAGIPVQVRNNLRQVIPPLMRDLTARIDANLSVLKSRTHVQIQGGRQGVMIENAQGITGVAEMIWTGDEKASMVPAVLESGSKPHVIRAVNAKTLAFFWDKVGKTVFPRQVMHPGFPGIHYMERAFEAMKPRIVVEIEKAVKEGAKK